MRLVKCQSRKRLRGEEGGKDRECGGGGRHSLLNSVCESGGFGCIGRKRKGNSGPVTRMLLGMGHGGE